MRISMAMKKKLGISLLEVMLSLSVIAILLIAATRYYSTTSSARKVNDAVQLLKNVSAAVYQWRDMVKNRQTTVAFSAQTLVDVGLLPEGFARPGANPWGGNIALDAQPDGSEWSITLTNVPQGDCLTLAELAKRDEFNTTCENNNFIAKHVMHDSLIPIPTP